MSWNDFSTTINREPLKAKLGKKAANRIAFNLQYLCGLAEKYGVHLIVDYKPRTNVITDFAFKHDSANEPELPLKN